MTFAQSHSVRRWGAMLFALACVIAACVARPAGAMPLRDDAVFCHAETSLSVADGELTSLAFSCGDEPVGYQRASLWLRASIDRLPGVQAQAIAVRYTRFERLAVAFVYADGAVRWQRVRRGDYGAHWRVGGQLLFEAPDRSAPLVAVAMRFDRLTDHSLLHPRLISADEAGLQAAGMAAMIGASLTLLLVSGIYSLSLAVAARCQYLVWQAAWSGVMIVWGALWSQIHLAILPAAAGTPSARAATLLACLAIAVATASAVTAIGRDHISRGLQSATLVLGFGIGLAGIPLALTQSGDLGLWGQILGVAIIVDLLAVALCLGRGWRRGSVEARDFALAWGLPMAMLALVHVVDVEDGFWGAGSKLPVLVAATWQALWLSAAATRRLSHLRVERDHARAAEAHAQALARRDPLTGLANRRGFVERVTPLLAEARAGDLPAALLLVDIDRFKSVNDGHGHEVGDEVLCRIARRIDRWEGPMCTVARLGGEEFGLLTVGMEGIMLDRFAESIRREIAACDHRDIIGDRRVTASVGVAEAKPAVDFQQLYRFADAALYEAKRAGRDRVDVQRYGRGGNGPPDRDVALLN
ncbi:GGDEF domain-containing protein [Sphingopyxis indica]|uniref:diguanylate cyclase n=1 Tax=Sphingopyxis indica TaxID=436663 RepID=A0A239GME8_9SPHN|nr:GGDEF domain-containing protein [Sphingopyxis indica]SNS70141.1 diguanylate cyclase (GGDEF) domain-containing protein [Sphingopyxis indica]